VAVAAAVVTIMAVLVVLAVLAAAVLVVVLAQILWQVRLTQAAAAAALVGPRFQALTAAQAW
jgi:hypothetical protein